MSMREFKVKMHGRAGIEYREGRRRMMIDSEMLAGPDFDLVVYADSIARWEPPHERDAVTADERTRIRRNISDALKSLRIDWQ